MLKNSRRLDGDVARSAAEPQEPRFWYVYTHNKKKNNNKNVYINIYNTAEFC